MEENPKSHTSKQLLIQNDNNLSFVTGNVKWISRVVCLLALIFIHVSWTQYIHTKYICFYLFMNCWIKSEHLKNALELFNDLNNKYSLSTSSWPYNSLPFLYLIWVAFQSFSKVSSFKLKGRRTENTDLGHCFKSWYIRSKRGRNSSKANVLIYNGNVA